jgi:hypothetical protein
MQYRDVVLSLSERKKVPIWIHAAIGGFAELLLSGCATTNKL